MRGSFALAIGALALGSGCSLDPVPYEGHICRTYLDCLVAAGWVCQPVDAGDGIDGGVIGICVPISSLDSGVDASVRDAAGRDSGDASLDGAIDAAMDDAAMDDAAMDDAGNDAATDDAGNDAATDDAGNDAATDDAGNDAAMDDAGNDAAIDAGNDAA